MMGYEASDLLRNEHRQVEDHLDRLLDALKHLSAARVRDVHQSFEEIHRLVSAHMDEEEQILYPAIQPFAEHLISDMLRQHNDIRETDRCLEELLSDFPELPTVRNLEELYRVGVEVHDAVQVHIVDEEEGLLKLVDQHLSDEQQHKLVAIMQGAIATTPQTPDRSDPMRKSDFS
jgi:hemerythrin-like domain-containing protein